ncbi:hypothetical protein [Arcicella rosea]|uniref:Uncharacterized protein n=1 Tax=Arcicella rosea TaxID=502909 RepID=A0A841ET61_9BACT|nr:hypothetical protein [Arcicella rosea]MBB6005544.1 hypothetical protein [Arcicella rosea]
MKTYILRGWKYIIILVVVLSTFTNKALAQYDSKETLYTLEKYAKNNKANKSILTEILSEKLQFAFDNKLVNSTDNKLEFKGSLQGWKTLFSHTDKAKTAYLDNVFSRNFEMGGGIIFDSQNQLKVKGLNLNLKYAIINNRDPKTFKYFEKTEKFNKSVQSLLPFLTQIRDDYQNMDDKNLSIIDKERVKNSLDKFTKQQDISLLDPLLLEKINKSSLQAFEANFAAATKSYDSTINKMNNASIWTIALNSNYVDKKWSEITLQTEFIKGLGGIEREREDYPWDLYGGVFFKNLQDTTNLEKSINRTVLTGKFGVNKVLALSKTDIKSSALEVLLNVEYNYIPRGRYSNEEEKTFMLASTISIRLAPNVYFPVEIKYDPKNGNFFGFLKVKWDMLRFNQ